MHSYVVNIYITYSDIGRCLLSCLGVPRLLLGVTRLLRIAMVIKVPFARDGCYRLLLCWVHCWWIGWLTGVARLLLGIAWLNCRVGWLRFRCRGDHVVRRCTLVISHAHNNNYHLRGASDIFNVLKTDTRLGEETRKHCKH